MPRQAIQDELQIYRFWLLDISVLDSLSAPVLNPLSGFSSITAPEITSETVDIVEGNWYYKRKITGKASVSPITLMRGAKVWDHDFYNWIIHTITGEAPDTKNGGLVSNNINKTLQSNPSPRRNLLLVQFFVRNPFFDSAAVALSDLNLLPANLGSTQSAGVVGNLSRRGNNLANEINFGPASLITLVPARAWMLFGCMPTRYKASQDFNAKSGDVSIMELALSIDEMEEIEL